MCRFMAWQGAPRYFDELVFETERSLINQSRNALIGKTPINADGFGLGWYSGRAEPCTYKDIHPAWSDPNLKTLCHHTRAKLFFAHVRATTGTATSRNNCHPFHYDNWMYMHNGQAGGHEHFRKELDGLIPTQQYGHRLGGTESEAIFLIAIGLGLNERPIEAMAEAVAIVENLSRERGFAPYMRFASCWTDGTYIYAARYASDRFVPSLWYQLQGDGVVIASEPLDDDTSDWSEVLPNQVMVLSPSGIAFERFVPQTFATELLERCM